MLDAALKQRLLEYLADRLSTGEVLITPDQFQKASAEGYELLTGGAADDRATRALSEWLDSVHSQDAAQLQAPGVENWISLSVFAQVRKAGLDITDVQERGTQLVRDFLREPKTKALLGQLGLTPNQVNMSNCLRYVVNRVAGRKDDGQSHAASRLARLAQEKPVIAAAESGASAEVDHEARIEALMEGPVGLPDEAETEARKQEQKASRTQIRQGQMDDLVANLDNYVTLGRISAEDAARLRKVHQVDEAMKAGTVERDKGSKIRNSILSGQVRDRIDRKVKEALDYAVAYVQVFEALGRIETRFDPALRFLVRFGQQVNAEADEAGSEMAVVVSALIDDVDSMRLLIDLMDRKDAEVRMIAARLPPYSYVIKRDQTRLERLAVDEDFVDQLRTKSVEDLTLELHAGDRKVRARPAAAMLSVTALIDRLIKPTPIRKELRLLKVNLIIEEFYHATDDVEQARQRAHDFLRGRMKSLYPDMSPDETAALQQRGDEMIERVEARVVAERAAARAAKGAPAAAAEDPETLTEDDRKHGVQIHRVTVRGSAGRTRQIPFKIMPDPDDATLFVVAQRDPESREMVPMMRGGGKRYVQRGRDGSWELTRG